MSRRTRPLRRVRGADLDRLLDVTAATWLPTWRAYGRRLLGLPVSARAAGRILVAATPIHKSTS